MGIRNIMNARVVTVGPDDSLQLVKEIFDNVGFHHLLVVEDRRLVGIISDRDLLKVVSPYLGTPSETARDAAVLRRRAHQIMTRNPVCLDEEASIRQAIALFNGNAVSCLPVVNAGGVPVGIVSWRDILRVLDDPCEEETAGG